MGLRVDEMISVQQAIERLLQQIQPVGVESLEIGRALNRVICHDVLSPIDFPLFTNSSMDGYAVIAADVAHASSGTPVLLDVVVDIPAGVSSPVTLIRGQAARIMTGAPLPAGADAVVPVEATDQPGGSGVQLPKRVSILETTHPGNYIRSRGQDLSAGQKVLSAGRQLKPQDTGLLAMLGIPQVDVYRAPRVALLSSGDELIPVDQPLGPGQIHDSNSVTLLGLLDIAGQNIISLGIARDQYADIKSRLDRAVSSQADLIISTAGVSVGSFDYIRKVIEDHGDLDFWQINIRPGKPFTFGHYQGIPMIGLPGNPVSAFVGFEVFIKPVLARLSGVPQVQRLMLDAILDEPVESDGRESYLRAVLTRQDSRYHARLTGHQGSGNLLSLVRANALLIVPSGVKSLPAGTTLQAWLIDHNG